MGSNQSTPAIRRPTTDRLEEKYSPVEKVESTNDATKEKRNGRQQRTGFALVQHKCKKKKLGYDKCYASLYGSFVSAKETDNSGCEELFDDWRECVLKGMKKDRDKRGVKTPLHKESYLAELEDDDK